jgi:hypothetical protein
MLLRISRAQFGTGAAGTTHFKPGGVSFWDWPIQKRENPPALERRRAVEANVTYRYVTLRQ